MSDDAEQMYKRLAGLRNQCWEQIDDSLLRDSGPSNPVEATWYRHGQAVAFAAAMTMIEQAR